MTYAIILFDDGTWNHTDINGTDEEICQYYWQFRVNPVRTVLIQRYDKTFVKYDHPTLYNSK